MTRLLFLFSCLLIINTTAWAQIDSVATPDDTTFVSSAADAGTSPVTAPLSLARHGRPSPAHITLSRDSILLLSYHHAGEVLGAMAGIQEFSLGNFGQPLWLGRMGSGPRQWTMTLNGSDLAGALTDGPEMHQIPIEDIGTLSISAQYDAFWLGGPGAVLAADVVEKEWHAPRPVTRLRHTEAANEYLYTDGMFTLDVSDRENVFIAGTRTVIGTSGSNDAARFANNRHESWNLRLRYRNQISTAVSARVALRYDDGITLLNGGVAPPLDADLNLYPYPVDGTEPFSTEAFDAKVASLVNTTMSTQRQRYTAEGGGRIQWDKDSAHVTDVRFTAQSEVSRFHDRMQELLVDSIADPLLNITDAWSRTAVELRHTNDLGWSTLNLAASASPYSAKKGGEMFSRSGLNTMLRGKLDLTLGALHATGMARLDNMYGRSALSAGAGADVRIGDALTVWGGVSYSPRIYSLTEQWYREGASATLPKEAPLEDLRTTELGARVLLAWLNADVRVFQRRAENRLLLRSTPMTGTLPGRYSLAVTETGESENLSGVSADIRIALWRFFLDQQGTLLQSDRTQSVARSLLAPERSYRAELYYRGSLIEGTLDLRIGGSFNYNSAYLPLSYHPLTGLFTYASPDNAWTYTDMWRVDAFVFATIKDRATIHVVLHNAFDTPYITTQFYPMFDRAVRIGVDWIFFD
ncbi:MAG: TonB-dependent receptor [Bacteroidia bacterium]|nr:TonB-dependent receptor [Bacteroidia bacterium]